MNAIPEANPALSAAQEAEALVAQYLQDHRSFLLEAGAGAGKTYSLVEALENLIQHEGLKLRRNHQRIACITYTNAATAVIKSRIDGNPLVFVDTIHAFCWSLIRNFQPALRSLVAAMPEWEKKLAEADGIGIRIVEYELGHRRVTADTVTLHHDDVLALMVSLLPNAKFQALLAHRCPFVLIDEYQDTDVAVMTSISEHLLGRATGPMIGLFGDHWQRIYDRTCGHVAHGALAEIGKKANFRSATKIVDVLNKMRPELPQAVRDEGFVGSAVAFHTNAWQGERRSGAGGGHWKDDLPAEAAHAYLDRLIKKLESDGWNLAPQRTKVLMLTHNILASEQGYDSIAKIFSYTDQFIKKEDPLIAFFCDVLEPGCAAFHHKRFGEMFSLLGGSTSAVSSHADKVAWSSSMEGLANIRLEGTIGQVLDYMIEHEHPRLPDAVLGALAEADEWHGEEEEEPPRRIQQIRQLRDVPYKEVIALDRFIDGHTPFATKHSVKGDEFENVLVVFGRGWNKYNFDQFLQWSAEGVPAGKQDAFERSRNLFYVCCSRPTTRLALLFTQELSDVSLAILDNWFNGAIEPAPAPQEV
ncbi:UvrD-helicase domain-containing protein [Stenotrophomonas maltophilia]|uniref:UvrD-helicase domain-containing protein n=1 Tax=Stenotrophomonas maltophilia TaxID=40324 RepID=UPI001F53DBD7|nr:UvrD-helicase domain-containing protein [Stenotrophomonas maltophilia]MCI1125089.1 UvrD-helicase domain-containing protein [Stenotrophomonas maltophilia]